MSCGAGFGMFRKLADRLRGGGFYVSLGGAAGLLCIAGAIGAFAQDGPPPQPAQGTTALPQINVTTVKRPPPKRTAARRPAPAAQPAPAPAPAAAPPPSSPVANPAKTQDEPTGTAGR